MVTRIFTAIGGVLAIAFLAAGAFLVLAAHVDQTPVDRVTVSTVEATEIVEASVGNTMDLKCHCDNVPSGYSCTCDTPTDNWPYEE